MSDRVVKRSAEPTPDEVSSHRIRRRLLDWRRSSARSRCSCWSGRDPGGCGDGGPMAADDGGRASLLEQFMPRFDTRVQHAIEIHAPARAVFTAVEAVTVKEVRLLRELEFIRALAGLAATGRLDVPTADAPLLVSFTRGAVLLGARPPEEVLAGAIGRFWRLPGNEPVVFGSPEEFLTFTEPGFAKAVVGFRLDPRGAEILLTSETRFVATDEATHRLMSRYWRIIRPGSNLIRTEWLRAIRRRALRRPKATPEGT